MFLDVGINGPNGHWDEGPLCKSCKRLISASEPAEELRFDALGNEQFEGMDGLYHSVCAKPYLSVLRAFTALGRFSS